MRNFLAVLFMMVFIIGISACSIGEPRLPPKESLGPSVQVKSYKMAVGDQVKISVWKNPSLSLTVPIRPDGFVSVPLVGDIMAAGLTPEELAAKTEKKLAAYIKAPNVTIILTRLQGHEFLSRIRVTGSVANNVSMLYHQGMTVLDAVLEAGSVDLYADANNTKLHRRTNKGAVSYDIRLKDIMQNGDMRTNIALMPGDIITVPERNF